jgi:hypothetical protein
MSFATAKDLQASKKTTLVRLTHKKDITGLIFSGTTPNYTYSLSHPIEPYAVKFQHQSSSSETDADSFSWDRDTKILTLQIPNVVADMSFVVVYSHLFFTDGFSKYLDKDDPTGAISDVVEWQPRLISNVSMSQNISNIFDFKLSITSSSISVDNNDNFLAELVTTRDTFYNQDLVVWFGINDNYQKIFSGTVGSLSISSRANFNIKDGLKRLQSKATVGDTTHTDSVYHSGIQYFDVDEIWNNLNQYQGYAPNIDNLTKGILTSQSEGGGFVTTSFRLGRYDIEPETASEIIHSVFAFTETVNGQSFDRVYSNDIESLGLGSIIRGVSITGGSITLYKPITDIRYTDDAGFSGWFRVRNAGSTVADINWSATTYRRFPVVIFYKSVNGEYLEPAHISTYSSFSATKPSGNENFEINVTLQYSTGVGNAETSDFNTLFYYALPNIDPDDIGFDKKHGSLIQFLAQRSGVSVNLTSINDSQDSSALTSLCRVKIPETTDTEPKTYLEYIQDIAAATFGIVSYNSEGELVYKLIDTVTNGDRDINETDILDGSLTLNSQWQDTKSEYKISNIGPFDYQDNQQPITQPSLSADRSLALYGNEYQNRITFESIISQNPYRSLGDQKWQNRLFLRLTLSSYSNLVYKFSTSHKFMDIEIGDTINLISEDVIGGSVPLMVTGYTKSLDKVSITATKLGESAQ